MSDSGEIPISKWSGWRSIPVVMPRAHPPQGRQYTPPCTKKILEHGWTNMLQFTLDCPMLINYIYFHSLPHTLPLPTLVILCHKLKFGVSKTAIHPLSLSMKRKFLSSSNLFFHQICSIWRSGFHILCKEINYQNLAISNQIEI